MNRNKNQNTSNDTSNDTVKPKPRRRQKRKRPSDISLLPRRKSKRETTRVKSAAMNSMIEQRELQKKKRKRKARKKIEALTQEQYLAEAAKTAEQSKIALDRLLELEAEQRKFEKTVHRIKGASIAARSDSDGNRVLFSEQCGSTMDECVDKYFPLISKSFQNSVDLELNEKLSQRGAVCVISGLPAKYRDPLTGHYYANGESFRELRKRHEQGSL